MTSLDDLRKKLDAIDTNIAALLKQRVSIIQKIGLLKAEESIAIKQTKRENDSMKKLLRICRKNGVCENYLTSVFKNMQKESRAMQKNIQNSED